LTTMTAKPSLFAHVMGSIGSDIAAGVYPVGSNIPPEASLCERYGVSRSVLREVLRVLSQKGMLHARPKVGIRVRPEADWNLMDVEVLDWVWKAGRYGQHVDDFLGFRRIVEPAAARMAATHATPEQRDTIASLCAALEASNERLQRLGGEGAGSPWLEAVEADLQFHGAIYESSGNGMLRYIGRLIVHMMRKQIAASTAAPGTFGQGIPFHRRLADSIAAGDAAAAFEASDRIIVSAFDTAAESRSTIAG
jgi:DNA-binding FadR family transcriptional regulator